MAGRRDDRGRSTNPGKVGDRPTERRRGLVMVSDADLLDVLLRTAAAAGCELVRAVDPTQARRHWPEAPLVLLDPAAARSCAESGLPRRRGVVVTVRGAPPLAQVLHRQGLTVGRAKL